MAEEIPADHERIELQGGPCDGHCCSIRPDLNVYEKKFTVYGPWNRYVRSSRKNNAGQPVFIHAPVRGKS